VRVKYSIDIKQKLVFGSARSCLDFSVTRILPMLRNGTMINIWKNILGTILKCTKNDLNAPIVLGWICVLIILC
jgi:hypothetical protein